MSDENRISPVVGTCGGGVNTGGLLIRIAKDQKRFAEIKPWVILFANTGGQASSSPTPGLGEKPETYEWVHLFSDWLVAEGLPEITWVYRDDRINYGEHCESLYDECIKTKSLPGIVRGNRSCSDNWKIVPQKRFIANWPPAQAAWARNNQIVRLIGYDAGEPWRAVDRSTAKELVRYPLVEWGWDRDRCAEEIKSVGLPVPPKSSCFFCPEMDENEIVELYVQHPELAQAALTMESGNVRMTDVKGLANTYSWGQIIEFHKGQMTLPILPARIPCTCYDGE